MLVSGILSTKQLSLYCSRDFTCNKINSFLKNLTEERNKHKNTIEERFNPNRLVKVCTVYFELT